MSQSGGSLAAIVVLCGPIVALATDPPAAPSVVAIQAGPDSVALDANVIVDGEPAAAFWNRYFDDLFTVLDRNDDGALDSKEASVLPDPAGLSAELRGDFDNVTARFASLADADRAPADGSVSRGELAQYLRSAGVGLCELTSAPSSRRLDVAVARRWFDLLAAPKAAWTSASFVDAYARLRRFDTNDDQRLSLAELRQITPSATPAAKARSVTQGDLAGVKFALTTQSATTPSIEATLRLNATKATIELAGARPIEPAAPDSLSCQMGPLQLKLRAALGAGAADFDSARDTLLQQFEASDVNRDRSLDHREVERSELGGYFGMLLAIADRNADGLLTRAEMDRYLNLQAAAARHCVVVSASDLGSPLFAVLDADGDETLSLRELRHGWSRVAAWDASGDQALSWDEIPQACQLTWSLGRPMAPPPSTTPPTTKLAAPPWFSGMDQNGDGDLSRREFLGSLEEFQRWDTDADGLISPEESRRMTKH